MVQHNLRRHHHLRLIVCKTARQVPRFSHSVGFFCLVLLHMCVSCSPFVVVVGWITGHDFTLDFDPFATLALTVSVMHANFVTSDARSHWLMVGGGALVHIEPFGSQGQHHCMPVVSAVSSCGS